MADFDDDEEDNKISEGMNNLNELGLIRDSNNNSNNFNLKKTIQVISKQILIIEQF
jgi:hypothetical protein